MQDKDKVERDGW